MPTLRSSQRRCSIKYAVLKNFAIFAGKDLCWSLRPAALLKKRLQHRYFSENITKILRTAILKNICERMFLYFRILRNFFVVVEKMANRNLGKVRNLGNLGKIIPSFLIFEFSILPYSQNRKLRFKNLGKKFPRFPRFPRFPSFRSGRIQNQNQNQTTRQLSVNCV